MTGALQRLQMQDLKGPMRYAIARNLQVMTPLLNATLEAFPYPENAKKFQAWRKDLESRNIEIQVFMLPGPPDVDDQVFAAGLRKQRAEGKRGDPITSLTDEQIEFQRRARNMAIFDAIMPLIEG